MLRNKIEELQSQAPIEKEWWEKRKAEIQSDFMKELDDDAATGESKKSDDDAVLVEGGGPSSQAGGKKNKKKGKN